MLNLCKQKMVPSSACNHCHVGEETVLHALWSCEAVCPVWRSHFPAIPSEFNRANSFRDLLEFVVGSSQNSEVFVMVCWALWNHRNKLQTGEVVWPLNQLAGVVRRHLQEFQQVWRCPSKKVRAQRPRWKPPDMGFVKANFDGAIFKDISAAGIGVAVRNELGEVVAAMAEKVPIPDSVFTLETLAARRAVLFVQELGLRNVVFEGD